MTGPLQYALTVGPLGFYLWVLALWQSDRHPRVVGGLLDFVMLALGIGGVLTFGPFGQLLVHMFFRRPDLYDWLVVASFLGLLASILARRALHRLVVYHVDQAHLAQALEAVLSETGGRFVATLSGYEDRAGGRGLNVDFTRWLRCAVVEARGRHPEELIQEVRPRLREHLRAVTTSPSPVALVLYGGSILVMVVPLVGLFLTQPRAREALRALIERISGV
jgi:hypothetical protein